MPDAAEAEAAMAGLERKNLLGQSLVVNEAREQAEGRPGRRGRDSGQRSS